MYSSLIIHYYSVESFESFHCDLFGSLNKVNTITAFSRGFSSFYTFQCLFNFVFRYCRDFCDLFFLKIGDERLKDIVYQKILSGSRFCRKLVHQLLSSFDFSLFQVSSIASPLASKICASLIFIMLNCFFRILVESTLVSVTLRFS